jgi:hypothetical protein
MQMSPVESIARYFAITGLVAVLGLSGYYLLRGHKFSPPVAAPRTTPAPFATTLSLAKQAERRSTLVEQDVTQAATPASGMQQQPETFQSNPSAEDAGEK